MKKNLIAILLVCALLPVFGQTTKKKIVKKPVKKAVAKKPIAKKEVAKPVEEVKPIEKTEQELAEEKLPLVGNVILKKSGYVKNRNSVYYKGIIGMMKGIYTNDNKVFVYLEIKNTSNLDYDIESVFFNTSPIKKRRENLELEEKKLYAYLG